MRALYDSGKIGVLILQGNMGGRESMASLVRLVYV